MEVGVVREPGLVKIRLMLTVSLLLLVPLGVLSNMTHSLTLALEAYHMLYNVLTIGGCLLALRLCGAGGSTKNTFGWARLDVLVTVMTLLFLAALCFSVSVEAVQAMVHAGHQDAIHHPVYIMACAAAVLLGHLLCYVLIGGFTNLQSTLLTMDDGSGGGGGGVRLAPASSLSPLRPAPRRFSRFSPAGRLWLHFLRDMGGTLLVVMSAAAAHISRALPVRYVDPVLALVGVVLLLATSRTVFTECCLILLQTMPDTFDVVSFRARLLALFPAVEDVHELHVWQLTPDCVVATAHVVLAGPRQFNDVAERVAAFFADNDIGHVTLQPEFSAARVGTEDLMYYMSSASVRETNPKCAFKTEIANDRSEPTILVKLDSTKSVLFKADNLTVLEVLKLWNQHITPLAAAADDAGQSTAKAGKAKAERAAAAMSMSEKKYQSTRAITNALYNSVPSFTDLFEEETFYIAAGTLVLASALAAIVLSRFITLKPVE
ncbi:zinc transporter 1-like [Pollicipes pollicipes]|uniref:zinc transporter 1-like n=1 Tax=Pollicipes pollicipes TaxID=41117 RepID=UPI0018850236|nr:zinc transporter 1-like [Pollicipes pollicipes]